MIWIEHHFQNKKPRRRLAPHSHFEDTPGCERGIRTRNSKDGLDRLDVAGWYLSGGLVVRLEIDFNWSLRERSRTVSIFRVYLAVFGWEPERFAKEEIGNWAGMALDPPNTPPLFWKQPPEIWKFAGSNVRKSTKPMDNRQNPLIIY